MLRKSQQRFARVRELNKTPWRKVFERFGAESQSEFARMIGRNRSKVSRALADDSDGLISGRDQKHLMAVAEKHGIKLEPSDLLPGA
jgi:hypothetical protein